MGKFNSILADIERVNDIDKKPIPEKMFKLTEEIGEFATELGKLIGMTHKPYDEKHFIEESADALQCLLSVMLQACKIKGIDFEVILDAIPEKNKKWEVMCKKYTRDNVQTKISDAEQKVLNEVKSFSESQERMKLGKPTIDDLKLFYPIGTKFNSLFGYIDIVINGSLNVDTYLIDQQKCVFVLTKSGYRQIYDGVVWAQIIVERPNLVQ